MNEVVHDETLADLELSINATNTLEANGVTTIEDLIKLSIDDLNEMRCNGRKMHWQEVFDIEKKLRDKGLRLAIQKWRLCPKCGSEPQHHEVRNHSLMWHDGDVYCLKCGAYVRMWDAG